MSSKQPASLDIPERKIEISWAGRRRCRLYKQKQMDYKPAIIDALDTLRKRDIAEKQPFKARAYATVINQLKYLDHIHHYEDLKDIKGVGEQIEKKIKEVLATGQSKTAEKAKELYHLDALDAFQKIFGVGPIKANDLVKMGFNTIAELKDAAKKQPKLLNDKQMIGLAYYDDLLLRIPREEMDQHCQYIYEFLPTEFVFETEIVGSYRRGLPSSGDIDVLIRVGKEVQDAKHLLEEYAHTLQKEGYVEEILALGEHKCMAICRFAKDQPARRLDLLIVPEEEYAYSLLYFTGSDRFNVAFRQHALTKGYTLNEHVLTPVNPAQPVKPVPAMQTEKDIFAFLGLRYIEPQHRVDHNQIIPLRKKPKVAPNGL